MTRRALALVAILTVTACNQGPASTTVAVPTATPATARAEGDGVLALGTLLPRTGNLAYLGPPMFAGVDLAIKEINAAGGVLGKQVTVSHTDSGDTTTQIAGQSADSLLAKKVDAIVGAASSSVSTTVLDKITGSGTLMFSPSATGIELTNAKDDGLFFRTAPPDVLQGRVLGDLAVSQGDETVAILAMQDTYGVGLADATEQAVTAGGGQVVEKVVYDPKAADFSSDVAKIKAKNPKGIVLIGFAETSKVVQELVKQGLTAAKHHWYMVDGNLSNTAYLRFPKGTLLGVKGTLPGSEAPEAFQKRLLAVDPKLDVFGYGPESYDAVNLIALAAEAARSDAGPRIAAELMEVSKGGEKCEDFSSCLQLLKAGKDLDYDGVSGPVEFNEAGDPTTATIGIYEFGPGNTFNAAKALEYRSGAISG
ncbi:ABC transporter substrate-binding protein [Nonomuraea sp. NBC_01738]|uniref:ABC transporter substrate-binding protein n=1 Tax=Nonomuraea sp. NBC_01738 TaxID=2976003 RepID=UPI002E0E0A58|nr:ABC transporter substrate-binding protein [Nonomuraea sp. NBC_01738]